MQFPSVHAEDLAGRSVIFPRDFGGRQTLAVVAFDLKARGALESWIPFILRQMHDGSVRGQIFAVMPRSMQVARGIILTAMRKAVPIEARAATVPLFVDIEAFCGALDIVDRTALYVCVVAPGGRVRAMQIGPYSDAAANAIETHLETPARSSAPG